MTQPPFGAQPPSGPGQPGQPGPGMPPGQIEINVQGNIFISNLVPPTVTIDGHKINGVHVTAPVTVPVPPGRRHIEAHSQWMRRYGQAALDVDVRPGELVKVYYAPPMHQFTTGNLGLEKQKMKGMGCFIVLIAVLVIILLASILAAFL